ncbi:MAG TPA: ECF-type sigma factor [Ideonella sp.]|uniref:ECF-type sigma factor n=1 Tax=Ideonella sp. TaxID=1929293 RepID=UPI002B7E3A7B|nr:ECF-type sigma factor [Ideonella sp.]HSI51819.1 ECF-type sigma factor [Ideonella sp.]
MTLPPTADATAPPERDHDRADGADGADGITQLLHQASAGDARAADEVVARLYVDLRRIAGSRLRQSGDLTLDATALVHESYLRLQRAGGLDFPDRKHFLGYAAKVMHSIVIDQVRARQAERRGGALQQVTFNTGIADLAPQRDDEVLRVHEALAELAAMDVRLAQVVEMRYFAGLGEAEIAETLGVTERTVQRDWAKARLFLSMAMK